MDISMLMLSVFHLLTMLTRKHFLFFWILCKQGACIQYHRWNVELVNFFAKNWLPQYMNLIVSGLGHVGTCSSSGKKQAPFHISH